jgi:molybdopterin-synthase adenylyltransferase
LRLVETMCRDHGLQPRRDPYARYARQIILPGVGREGQEKIRASHVLVAGIGGLGSLSSLYLCRAGVGQLTVVDSGRVQVPDLNRQLLYREKDVGETKVSIATQRLSEINPETRVHPVMQEITEDTFTELLRNVDVVVDGTDNYRTRFVMNRICWSNKVPLIYGGIYGLRGSAMTILPGRTPCLECFMTARDENGSPVPAIGPAVGQIATLQALEALKLILHLGKLLAGELLTFDGSTMTFTRVMIKKREGCSVCSG